jgi:ribulose-bisphosphate carboxylase small chain
MRITQGTFSYLPDFTDQQIEAQVQYCLDNGWPLVIEYTDDPHPRNILWEMWGMPMFDIKDPSAVMLELNACRKQFPRLYVRIGGYDRSLGRATTVLSIIVNRPPDEPGFYVERQEGPDRQVRYTIHSFEAEKPPAERYQ